MYINDIDVSSHESNVDAPLHFDVDQGHHSNALVLHQTLFCFALGAFVYA